MCDRNPTARSDWDFLRGLIAGRVVEYEVFGNHGYFRIVGKDLMLDDTFPDDAWSIFALPFFIGVKTFHAGLAAEWPALDWPSLEAEGRRLSDAFRSAPDLYW